MAANTEPATDVALPPRNYSLLAGLLSYLIPGLGQIYQGRVGKGLLFLICLYTLFFYGLYLGNWQNVYIQPLATSGQRQQMRVFELVLERARFLGQMWIGVAAWPAVCQYVSLGSNEDRFGQPYPPHSLFGKFEQVPSESELNAVLRDSDKAPDLGWMYTVVAGVLNILVIYDAFAGPAILLTVRRPDEPAAPKPLQEATVP